MCSRRSAATGPSRSPCDAPSGVAQTVPNTLNANGRAWFLPLSNTGIQRDGEKLCERTLAERVSGPALNTLKLISKFKAREGLGRLQLAPVICHHLSVAGHVIFFQNTGSVRSFCWNEMQAPFT